MVIMSEHTVKSVNPETELSWTLLDSHSYILQRTYVSINLPRAFK